MSVYLVKGKGKGWRYDFTLKGTRHTEAWFKTKKAATKAEAEKRKEMEKPKTEGLMPTDMGFLDLVNRRLDHVKAYNSSSHYRDVGYHCKRWVKEWKEELCSEITTEMIEAFLKMRLSVSPHVANKELQYFRALFNFGIKKEFVEFNPTDGIDFFPVIKRKKYVPPKEDVFKVFSVADPEAQQYLWTILLTAGRVGEINSLTWDDVDFERRSITLWTRKRKGGHREPREIPMIQKLYDVLSLRWKSHDNGLPWVFWHTYWSRKVNDWVRGPYGERNRLMSTLCKNAEVKYFRYHALRHLTASILDDLGISIGVIQRILGHQNRRTTEIYLHSVGEAERQAMAKLENTVLFQAPFVMTEPTAPTNVHMGFWNRKVQRPSYDVLKCDIGQLGYSATGRKYGVSDNAVRKWEKAYQTERLV